MSEYEFAADLVRSIAWPVLVFVLVLLLRKPLGELLEKLLPLVQSLRFKDLEVVLDREISQAESKSSGIGEGEEGRLLDQEMLTRIEISPRSAILESWLIVERELVEAALTEGISTHPRRGLSISTVRELEASGRISRELAAMIHDLRSVRNRAVHEIEIDFYPDAARRYVELASRISSELGSRS